MSQTILLQSPVGCCTPSSPDPTPLRMLAFSVAESALQADPNSPMFGLMQRMPPQDSWEVEKVSRWSAPPKPSLASRRGQSKPLWDMVEKARDRREKDNSPSTVDSPLPTSPTDYAFYLPTNSHLAASVASNPAAAPSKHGLRMPSPVKQYFPLYTRSAEPSPVKSTFDTLDQSQPPPEFKPRLSAKEFAVKSPSQVLKSQATSPVNYPSRTAAKNKLPSLAEIQRKLRGPYVGHGHGHKRNGSAGCMPRPTRSDSESSIELKTPEEEIDELNLVITRTASPPVESRLPTFLRQRTSGRLGKAPRPLSMPVSDYHIPTDKPVVMITPPSATPSVPPPSARSATPTQRSFTTPPMQYGSKVASSSPTESIRPISPTHSIPIITCTPAQTDDSDSETESEGDVVVFDGAAEELERLERERRGQAMKDKLLRRRSLQ